MELGLTSSEAAERLRVGGPNVPPELTRQSAARQLAGQMLHFFALLLWLAGALAIVAGMPELGFAIFVVVVVNGVFAFAQEHRAEKVTQALRDLVPRRAIVIRDGHVTEIDAGALVEGDLVLLMPGSRLSGDARLVTTHSLAVDESMLTGESFAAPKSVGDAVFAGTIVASGEARGIVTATGARTRLGTITHLIEESGESSTPLALELRRVVRTISTIAIAAGFLFMGVSLLLGAGIRSGFLFALGVTVALVPEGLLPTVTLSLAIGARRMASRHALVRRLESVETLGSTTFICTDKTGTLTLNEMTAVEVWTPDGPGYLAPSTQHRPMDHRRLHPDVAEVARLGALCSTGRIAFEGGKPVVHGDPTDAALHGLAVRLGITPDLFDAHARMDARIPFDPVRRRMSVVHDRLLIVKGAPDVILPLCDVPGDAEAAAESMADRGLRVIAIAVRPVDESDHLADVAELERNLRVAGIVGLEDPPRPEVADAIADCRRSGVAVAMVTGDHPKTAVAIARESGLSLPGAPVVTVSELPDTDDALGRLVDHDGIVLARITPEEKVRIARALKARGHVVAMTGDGVNDGPALREADIGVAMGKSGTDVAREAADVVLLDDNFETIVAAIEQGRATFSNIRRFLTYHLTDNVAEMTPFVVWALSGGRIPLALGVLQILCLDIGTDLLPALALGTEPPRELASRKPLADRHLLDWKLLRRVFFVLGPVEALMVMAAFIVSLLGIGWNAGVADPAVIASASGAAFAAVVLGQSGNAFACRSDIVSPWALGWTSNPMVLWGVAAAIGALVGFLFVPPIAAALGQSAPSLIGALIAFLAAPAVVGIDALYKRLRRSRLLARHAAGGDGSTGVAM